METSGHRAPSRLWTVSIVALVALAAAAATAALVYQQRASRPVGEGELFAAEAGTAARSYRELLAEGSDPGTAVRAVRNDLGIEAVGLVADGSYQEASAPELEGTAVPDLLAGALAESRLAAVALPVPVPISIDRVVEWEAGSVVYQVAQPLEPGSGLILSYDVSELLARRAPSQGVRPLTVQLLGVAVVLVAAASAVAFARAGARRRMAEAAREAALLQQHSEELRQHNRQLDEARRQAERALALAEETNRIRSEFVLMINHELRTPLTSVVTGAELLADQPDLSPDKRAAILRDVVRDGRRLKELIAQMLMVARLENRGIHFNTRPVAAGEILTRLQQITRHPVEDLEGPLTVDTDPDALVQLLASLADNALTHGASRVQVRVATEPGFEPQLTVGSVPTEGVWFLVEDDGPGIPLDFLPHAFEKFEKRGRASGTGLGLYLARAMAEGIDGRIAVQTGSDGTVMAVGVPSARVAEEVPA